MAVPSGRRVCSNERRRTKLSVSNVATAIALNSFTLPTQRTGQVDRPLRRAVSIIMRLRRVTLASWSAPDTGATARSTLSLFDDESVEQRQALASRHPISQQIELRLLRLRKNLRRFFSLCFGVNRTIWVFQMCQNVFRAIKDFARQAGQSRHLNPIALVRATRHDFAQENDLFVPLPHRDIKVHHSFTLNRELR